jgi:hypothetical protein
MPSEGSYTGPRGTQAVGVLRFHSSAGYAVRASHFCQHRVVVLTRYRAVLCCSRAHASRVTPRVEDRHRSQEFIAFLNRILQIYLEGEIHVILDNVVTYRSGKVQLSHAKPKHR